MSRNELNEYSRETVFVSFSLLSPSVRSAASFLDYDLGNFGLDTHVLKPLENPFGPKVLPM
jgi:hypothetical protein